MTGWRQTGTLLLLALMAGAAAGCVTSGSRFVSWKPGAKQSDEKLWAHAQLCETQGRLPEALESYRELYHRNQESARYAHRLGVVCTLVGDDQRAQAAYRRAHELDPNNPELLADMGYAAYLRADYPKAEELLQASLALAPDSPRTLSNLALTVGFQGRYEESLNLFRRVHGQDEVEAICNLAYVHAEQGETAEAAELYHRALKIDPSAKKASLALAQLKADKSTGQMVAGNKPYRKYMGRNAPKAKETKKTPEASLVADKSAAVPETAELPTQVTLAAADKPESSPAASSPSVDFAAGTETNQPLELPPIEAPMLMPIDSEAARSRRIMEIHTVTTDEAPFTVVEKPAVDSAPLLLPQGKVPDGNTAAKENDGWRGSKLENPEGDEAFSPKWFDERQTQITARKGKSGFMGFCPVALRDEQKLVDARPEFRLEYQSQTYEFSSYEALNQFASEPERYQAAAEERDVVAISEGTVVAHGSLEHALWFRHKLYLFANQRNMDLFRSQCRQFAVQQ